MFIFYAKREWQLNQKIKKMLEKDGEAGEIN